MNKPLTIFLLPSISLCLLSCQNNQTISATFSKKETNKITLNSIYFNDLDINSITKIRIEQGGIGVAPGSLTNIIYSTKQTDILNLYNALSIPLSKIDDSMIDGGTYYKYSFYDELNNVHEIKINNKIIHYQEAFYYLDFTYFYDISASDNCLHSFTIYNSECSIYDNLNHLVCPYQELNKIEFKSISAVTENANYYINSKEFEMVIYIIDINTFYVKNKNIAYFYELETSQNQPNFSFLF